MISLSLQEVHLAAQHGMMRRLSALKKARPDKYTNGDLTAWQGDIDGAIAELAVSKAFGTYWSGSVAIRAVDAGSVEVRATRYESGHLIVQRGDADDAVFVLAIVGDTRVRLAGYIGARAARVVGEFREERCAGWWVAQSDLFDVADILPAAA